MGKKHVFFLMLILVISTLISIVPAQASNMGFKLTYTFTKSGFTGQNWFSLPYNVSLTNADDLMTDIGGNVVNIQYWDEANDKFEAYTGSTRSNNFSLEAGRGYMVSVSAATTYVTVGSHDPSKSITLTKSGFTGQNWVSLPYHTKSTNAADLKTEIETDIAPNTVVNIQYWDEVNDKYEAYTGSTRSNNFSLQAGRAYMVSVDGTGTWTPSHF